MNDINMKVTFYDGKIYEGTAKEIVAEMASRDHVTSNPWKYIQEVKDRLEQQHGQEVRFPNTYTDFLEALERFGYITKIER